jgi:hypothetical protein
MFGISLLVRLPFAIVLVGVPVLLVGALVWWTTSRKSVAADSKARQTRSARLKGLGLGGLGGLIAVLLGEFWLGPVIVAAGYLLGVHNGELHDTPPRTGTVRSASLRARTAAHYVPRWAAVVSVVAVVLSVFGPLVLIGVPTPEYGPWQPFPDAPFIVLPGQKLAWPSPVVWVPLAAVACGALVVGALLIRRLLRLPDATADQPGIAEPTRRNAARTITGTVVGIELLVLGALTLLSSSGVDVPDQIGGAAYTASRILIWTGIGLIGAGVVIWCALAGWRRGPVEPNAPAGSSQA